MATQIKRAQQEYSLWLAMVRAWALYQLHARTILPISILLYGIANMGFYFLSTTGLKITSSTTGIVYAILELQLIMVIYQLFAKNLPVSAMGKLDMEKEATTRVFKTFILHFVLISLSVFLLVIPAIILSVWWAFSVFIALDTKLGGMDALKKSRELVRGRFWKILAASTIKNVILISLTVGPSLFITHPLASEITASLAGSVVAPYFFILFYVIYRSTQQVVAPKLPEHAVAPV